MYLYSNQQSGHKRLVERRQARLTAAEACPCLPPLPGGWSLARLGMRFSVDGMTVRHLLLVCPWRLPKRRAQSRATMAEIIVYDCFGFCWAFSCCEMTN